MAIEDVMGAVARWNAAIDACAALGAQLTLLQSEGDDAPEVMVTLKGVSDAAGLGDLTDLAPPQRAMVLALTRSVLRQAVDLLDHPAREPGWAFTDPEILDGWGRGSMMVPGLLAASEELAGVERLLDVGTGVGLLAVAATNVWPNSTIVGIDTWEPSLERARANVSNAGLDARITLRAQNVVDLDDVDEYDCAWVPTFFMTEDVLTRAVPAVFRSVQPGGWIVLARLVAPPDPLAEATLRLRTIRNGGCDLSVEDASKLLEHAGCTDVHALPRVPPIPMEFVLGRRPG
jgi:SAM-dependent methyltransferase